MYFWSMEEVEESKSPTNSTHPFSYDPSKIAPSVLGVSFHGPTHELDCATGLGCPEDKSVYNCNYPKNKMVAFLKKNKLLFRSLSSQVHILQQYTTPVWWTLLVWWRKWVVVARAWSVVSLLLTDHHLVGDQQLRGGLPAGTLEWTEL